MRIPLANEVTNKINSGNVLTGVTWFKWTLWGLRFTYFIAPDRKWNCSNIVNIERRNFSDEEYTNGFEIDDRFLRLSPFKSFGIPLKGQGYVVGLNFRQDGLYYDFIYETEYLAHIRVKMSSTGEFEGKIIVPPTWDLAKREKILLATAKNVNVDCLDILEGAA